MTSGHDVDIDVGYDEHAVTVASREREAAGLRVVLVSPVSKAVVIRPEPAGRARHDGGSGAAWDG